MVDKGQFSLKEFSLVYTGIDMLQACINLLREIGKYQLVEEDTPLIRDCIEAQENIKAVLDGRGNETESSLVDYNAYVKL